MDLSETSALVLISVDVIPLLVQYPQILFLWAKPPDGWVGRVACYISCLHGVSGDLSGESAWYSFLPCNTAGGQYALCCPLLPEDSKGLTGELDAQPAACLDLRRVEGFEWYTFILTKNTAAGSAHSYSSSMSKKTPAGKQEIGLAAC